MNSSQLGVAQEKLSNEVIASNLGLSLEEVVQWAVGQDLDQSEEGVLFGHIVRFAPDTPQAVLEKAGAEEGEYFVILSDLYEEAEQ
ncbi:hypothetical protein D3C76_541730 [compost metagenome]